MNYYVDRNAVLDALNEAQIEYDENYKGLGEAKKQLTIYRPLILFANSKILEKTLKTLEISQGSVTKYISVLTPYMRLLTARLNN